MKTSNMLRGELGSIRESILSEIKNKIISLFEDTEFVSDREIRIREVSNYVPVYHYIDDQFSEVVGAVRLKENGDLMFGIDGGDTEEYEVSGVEMQNHLLLTVLEILENTTKEDLGF